MKTLRKHYENTTTDFQTITTLMVRLPDDKMVRFPNDNMVRLSDDNMVRLPDDKKINGQTSRR